MRRASLWATVILPVIMLSGGFRPSVAAASPYTELFDLSGVAARPLQDEDEGDEDDPDESDLSCAFTPQKAPRGGQIKVTASELGQSPLVRIGGTPAKLIRRAKDAVAVQVPRDSNGGKVTLTVEGETAECGSLTIIGLD